MTKVINPTQEFIEGNFEKTINLVNTCISNTKRKESLIKLLSDFAEKYMLAPASTRKDFYCCFPGGLCYHNLHVLKFMNSFCKQFDSDIPFDSLLTVSILHEFGKVGDKDSDYYLPLTSNYHMDRGIYYEINGKIDYMRVPHRSLFFAQNYFIELNREEYVSILLGDREEENKYYNFKEPELATVLKICDEWAIKKEKELKVIFPLPG